MGLPLDLRRGIDEVRERAGGRGDDDAALHRLVCATSVATELAELADAVLGHFVAEARADGATWTEIGEILGVTKQGAQQRFAGPDVGRWQRAPERLLPTTKRALVEAQRQARARGAAATGPEHLLLGLVADDTSAAVVALRRSGATPAKVRRAVDAVPGPRDAGGDPVRGRRPLSPLARRTIVVAGLAARDLGEHAVGPEHVLLGVARVRGPGASVLATLGVTDDRLGAAVAAITPWVPPGPPS